MTFLTSHIFQISKADQEKCNGSKQQQANLISKSHLSLNI